MPKVHLLPPDVISKIAAGEVIERPASVIKELVENSLDAGATAIEVHLKDAGKTLIHVRDNGHGIARDDLETIFLRHATSKITSIDDLESLRSMGFRGEALYAIASIADVTLRSQTAGQPTGWEIRLRGGTRTGLQPSPAAEPGTDIKVSELFFNTPARKKFMKSNTAELNQILNVFLPYTLLYPRVAFTLTHMGRALIDLKPIDGLPERAAHALNLESKHMIEVQHAFKDSNLTLRMLLGNINIQRARKDLQFIFVNNRPVQNRSIAFNAGDIFRLIFPPSVYPFFAIYLDVSPSDVDVNIHPAKREVKLKDEARLCSVLRHAIEQALMTQGQPRQVGTQPPDKITSEFGVPSDKLIFGPGQTQSQFNARWLQSQTRNELPLFGLPEETTIDPLAKLQHGEAHLFQKPQETLTDKLGRARYVGSFINKFLIFEADQSLLIVDQHAAQERIMFEKFRKQIEEGAVEVQHLLSPIVLKLTPQERLAWDEMHRHMQSIGLETTPFDDDTVAVHAHPALIRDPERAVRLLLSGETLGKWDHTTVARRACRASIMTGDRMSPQQADYQRQQLLACEDPFTCPHGRPVLIELTEGFLDKQFLRT